MLEAEPLVLDGRQGLPDAQAAFAGPSASMGYFSVSWYGTAVSDERGSFGVVDPALALADAVGEVVEVTYEGRHVRVYVIGSQDGLGTDLGITRRSYLELELLAVDPIIATVGTVSVQPDTSTTPGYAPPGPPVSELLLDGGAPTTAFIAQEDGGAPTTVFTAGADGGAP